MLARMIQMNYGLHNVRATDVYWLESLNKTVISISTKYRIMFWDIESEIKIEIEIKK